MLAKTQHNTVNLRTTFFFPLKYMDKLKFNQDTSLYQDAEYFQTTAGGFNNIGFGTAVASFSLGWNRSPLSFQMQKVKGPVTAIDKVCSEEEVVLIGYPHFVVSQRNINAFGMEETINMHGAI